MDPQMSNMFLQLMAQNQQLMTQLMTQNANSTPVLATHKSKHLDALTPITLTEFLDDFEFLALSTLNGYTLPEFYAHNILNNLNRYETSERPIQLVDKKRKKIYYKEGNEWLHDDKWFMPVYNKIFKYYCGKFASAKKKNIYKYVQEADDNMDDKDIDEVQNMIGKFYDVTKYPFAVLKDKTITRLASKMTVDFDE